MRHLALPVILLAAVGLRLPAFFQPPWYLDEGIFAAVGKAWLNGGTLYIDAWDNKPPGIFAVYAAGWATGLDMVAVRLLALAAMAGVIVMVYAMGRRAGGEAAGLVGAAVAGLLLGLPVIEGHIANTETFLILFSSLGMYVLLQAIDRERPAALLALAGGAFGAALLFKQTAAFDILGAAAFLALVLRRDWRWVPPFAAGLCLLPGFTALAFLAYGHLGDLWSATVTSLIGYRQDSGEVGLERYAVALMPAAIAAPFALWLQPWRTRRAEVLFVLWLAATAMAVAASGRAYPHYLIQVTPALALVAGMAASAYAPRLPRAAASAGLVVASLALIHVILGPLPNLAWNREPDYTRAYYANFLDYALGDIDRTAYDGFFDSRAYAHLGLYEEVEAAGLRGRSVFVWGDVPWLYVEAGLENPTPYTALLSAIEVEDTPAAVAEHLLRASPAYVLVMEETRPGWEEVQPLLGDRYAPVRQMLWAVLYAQRESALLD